jgi:ABC-type transport system involved in multi-copper enzyme maturation permease subunit
LGTVELLIARPVSRLKLFVARYAAGMGILITFTVISVFTIIPLAGLHGVEYLSFFHYCAYSDALVNQSLYGTGCLVFVCISRNVRRISVE